MIFSVRQRLPVQMSRRGIVLWKTLVTGHSTGEGFMLSSHILS